MRCRKCELEQVVHRRVSYNERRIMRGCAARRQKLWREQEHASFSFALGEACCNTLLEAAGCGTGDWPSREVIVHTRNSACWELLVIEPRRPSDSPASLSIDSSRMGSQSPGQ
jgi:hypothetical protein